MLLKEQAPCPRGWGTGERHASHDGQAGLRVGRASVQGVPRWVLLSNGFCAPTSPRASPRRQRGARVGNHGSRQPPPPLHTRTRCREAGPECRALSGPERPARNRPAEWTDRISRPGPCRTLLTWLAVWPPPSGSLGVWNQATSCLSWQQTGLHSKKFVARPWILTIRWPEKLGTFLFCLLKCLMTKILFSFLMWVSKDERPMCVICTPYEISPKLV